MAILDSARLDHCSYVVPNLDATVDFFTQWLGFELVSTHGPVSSPNDDRLTRTFAVPDRAVGRSAFLQQGGTQLEFVEWAVYGQGINPLRESTVPGCHIALRVDDLDATVALLKEGVPRMMFLEKSPDGYIFCFTPFGFQLQLIGNNLSI